MKLLLTNDDGIDAPGLAALESAVEGGVYIAAPHEQRSECGHQVTTRRPLVVHRRGERSVAVEGTPADCVRLALRGDLFEASDFDWVLSGINEGGNLGVDIYYSGTVAAAREAAILGQQAIAFSHYRRAQMPIDWDSAARKVAVVFATVRERAPSEAGFWNVNLPHLGSTDGDSPIVDCEPSRLPLPVAFRETAEGHQYTGVYAERAREEGSDVAHCFGGQIARSYIRL